MKISRREFIQLTFGFAASLTLFSLTRSLPSRSLVRPPGAVEEENFLRKCIKCGICVDVCPTHGLSPATLSDGIVNVGTPKLTGYCEINCTKCMDVCPTGALQRISVNEKDMGTAVIVKEKCRGWLYGTCLRCVERCPLDLIYATNGRNPVVDGEKCIGCAQCVIVCPVSPPAIYVVPEGAKRFHG